MAVSEYEADRLIQSLDAAAFLAASALGMAKAREVFDRAAQRGAASGAKHAEALDLLARVEAGRAAGASGTEMLRIVQQRQAHSDDHSSV